LATAIDGANAILAGTSSIILNGATVASTASVTNRANLSVNPGSTDTVNGAFTNDTSGVLTLQSYDGTAANLTFTNGMTNNGVINLTHATSCCAAGNTTLTISGGTL